MVSSVLMWALGLLAKQRDLRLSCPLQKDLEREVGRGLIHPNCRDLHRLLGSGLFLFPRPSFSGTCRSLWHSDQHFQHMKVEEETRQEQSWKGGLSSKKGGFVFLILRPLSLILPDTLSLWVSVKSVIHTNWYLPLQLSSSLLCISRARQKALEFKLQVGNGACFLSQRIQEPF